MTLSLGADAQIRSKDNPRVRALRALVTDPQTRRRLHQCWVEGPRFVEAVLAAMVAGQGPSRGWRAQTVVWAYSPEPTHRPLIAQAQSLGADVLCLDDTLFRHVSGVEAPQGIGLVLARDPEDFDALGPEALALCTQGCDLLILDGLQDPGNMGSMIRTAVAAGVGQIVITEGSTEAFSPKALRAGAGAQFLVPIAESCSVSTLLGGLEQAGIPLVVTLPPAALGVADLYADTIQARLADPRPLAWVLGQEGQGVSASWQTATQIVRVTIPHPPTIESLNVTAAAAVVLFERLRCRRL